LGATGGGQMGDGMSTRDETSAEKLPYEAPTLTSYGSVEQWTQGTSEGINIGISLVIGGL
jgi:hypothetical protein